MAWDAIQALYDIETAPAQMYEKLMKSDPYKLSISMVSGIASGMTSRYAKAIDTYETTGTKVREVMYYSFQELHLYLL